MERQPDSARELRGCAGLANRRLQPLGHLSGTRTAGGFVRFARGSSAKARLETPYRPRQDRSSAAALPLQLAMGRTAPQADPA
jgi:hypothetical protein